MNKSPIKDDQWIIQGLINRDEKALSAFWEKYGDFLFTIIKNALPIGTYEDIEECLEMSITYIWFHIDIFDAKSKSFQNWCAMIAYDRACLKQRTIQRHNRRVERYKEYLNTPPDNYRSAENEYFQTLSSEAIKKIINSLDEPGRSILIHRYIYGEMPREIAAQLNMSVKKVNNCLFYAKKKLRESGMQNEQKAFKKMDTKTGKRE